MAGPVAETISVLAGDPLAVRATIAVGAAPVRLALDARAGRLYAIDPAAGRLAVIATSRGAATASVALGFHPTDVAVDPAAGRVFVADSETGTIAVLGRDATPLGTLRAGAAPYGLAADPAGGRLYATDLAMNGVWRIEDRCLWGPVARLFARANVRESPVEAADPSD